MAGPSAAGADQGARYAQVDSTEVPAPGDNTAALVPYPGSDSGACLSEGRATNHPRMHGEVGVLGPTTMLLASSGQHAGQPRCRTLAVTVARAMLPRESGWAGGRERHAAWQDAASWQLNMQMNMTSTCQRVSYLATGHRGTGAHPLGLDRVSFKGRGFGLAAVASIRGGWSSPCKRASWPPLRCILLAGQGDHVRRHHVADTCSQVPLRSGPCRKELAGVWGSSTPITQVSKAKSTACS